MNYKDNLINAAEELQKEEGYQIGDVPHLIELYARYNNMLTAGQGNIDECNADYYERKLEQVRMIKDSLVFQIMQDHGYKYSSNGWTKEK